MCGIATIFTQKPLPDAENRIRRMTDAMQHRGPDADGFYVDEHVALGHRRLSIIDLSPLGNQPMWDAIGRYAIVFNGEIYNYKELRAQLPDYPFRSQSDTEVMLAGFARWGTGLFEKLNGIFGLILYDKQAGEIFAVRDRLGIKPLYFAENQELTCFASEQRAILKSGFFEKKLNRSAIPNYLWNGAIAGEASIVEGIRQVPAGHFLRLKKGEKPHIEPFHQIFQNGKNTLDDSPETIRKNVRELLTRAVERQMISDVPLGAFLSGGIDSSAVVASMSQVSRERPLTFTIGFREKQFDETQFAEQVARKFNTRHTTLLLEPADFLQELPQALDAMDTPTLDGVNSFVVSKITRRTGVTVALSGLGGDELFAGYGTFCRFLKIKNHAWWSIPFSLRRALAAPLTSDFFSPKMRRLAQILRAENPGIENVYPSLRSIFDEKTVENLLGEKASPNPVAENLQKHKTQIGQFPPLSQYSIAEMLGYTSHMLLKDTDQMSMASSLEVRVPFFDNDLIEYVLRVPDAVKFSHTPKQLLVSALGDLLPPEIVNRPKMGFTLPWNDWLRGELKMFCDERIESLCQRGLLAPDPLKALWINFLHQKKHVLWSHVWMFVVLEHWIRKNLD